MKAYYVFRKYFNWSMNVDDVKTIETWRDGLCFVFKEPDEDGDEEELVLYEEVYLPPCHFTYSA